jgi:uncharacterized membrane protein YdjX (TVP38/TMEM64 family)
MEEDNFEQNKTKEQSNKKTWILRSIIILVIVVVIVLIVIFKSQVNDALSSFINWVRDHNVAGPFALIVVYIFCTVLFIPGSILTLGAGLAFK